MGSSKPVLRHAEFAEEEELHHLLADQSSTGESSSMSSTPTEKHVAIDSRPDDSDIESSNALEPASNAKAPWWSYIWDYDPGRSKEETAFVQRLDISVLVILSLGYFIKNLDQTNIRCGGRGETTSLMKALTDFPLLGFVAMPSSRE